MNAFQEHVRCNRCGKRVSGVDPELGIVVRAWVQCPECLEHDAQQAVAVGDRIQISVELIRQITEEPDFTTHVVQVREVRAASDGTKVLVLERIPE